MSKKKVYRVGFYYQEMGHTLVEASNQEEAEALLTQRLEHEGIDFEFDCNDREYGATNSDEAYQGAVAQVKGELILEDSYDEALKNEEF